jgi:hypothetical protein
MEFLQLLNKFDACTHTWKRAVQLALLHLSFNDEL